MVHEGKKWTPTIYSEAPKALYGTVDASRLFFEDLSDYIINTLHFVRNPYDWCTLNKDVNGKQCTIVFHVDDLMISHMDPGVVTSVINGLERKYGGLMPLTVKCGKVHQYLGMTFDFNNDKAVNITMFKYSDAVIGDAPKIYTVTSREN